jgi:hypothetical protein
MVTQNPGECEGRAGAAEELASSAETSRAQIVEIE